MEYVIQRPDDKKCLKLDHRGKVIWVRPQHRTPEIFRTQRIAREVAKDITGVTGEVRTLASILKEVSK